MKIFLNKEKDLESNFNINIGSRNLNIFFKKDYLELDINDLKIFIEGELYYSAEKQKFSKITALNLVPTIKSLIKNYGIMTLREHLEGSYLCCWVDKNKLEAGFFSDSQNRFKAYFSKDNKDIKISSELSDLVLSSNGYDQLSLYSYMMLGYPADSDTFYTGVKKLGSDEYFIFTSDDTIKKKFNFPPVMIENFDKNDLNVYDDIFENSVSSRASKNNVVMNSGGWDSTSIVYKLTKTQIKDSVSAAVFDVKLPDGQSYNSYEVDKVKRIGNFFKINTEVAAIDYNDNTLVDYWESHIENLRNNHTYFWLHHLKISDKIGLKAKNDTRVFHGEGSDAIHNFGFSQFVSVNYDDMQLREIADKGKSYLYSPTFFEIISKNNQEDNKILNFFQKYHGIGNFEKNLTTNPRERNLAYFESFMLSSQRVPFAKWQLNDVATNKLQNDFKKYIELEYFNDMATQCLPETLYYWLLQIYRRFHFNSYQIGVTQTALNLHNIHCVMPFLDSHLIDFMYKMPENWGRGLELKTTKYPLRFLAEHNWEMPMDILMEKGPHSYISENDTRWSYSGGSWNIYCEIMFKSVFADYFRSVLSKVKIEDVFDKAFFKVDLLNTVIKDYIEGKDKPENVTTLFRLAILFSIGFLPK